MKEIIVIAVIILILSLAIYKIIKDKKRGVKCSGCSSCGASCPSNKNKE